MTCVVDCEEKLDSRVSHASIDVVASMTIPMMLSVREETMAHMIDWTC
jgi:hypothetical protein